VPVPTSVVERDPGSDTDPSTFPSFQPVRVRMPIEGGVKTIWPEPKQTRWEWAVGFPLEIHPFAWDYLWLSCDGHEVRIKPHYLDSTWDTFWTDTTGHVRAVGLAGLFPFTLGNQVDLLEGIIATLGVLPNKVASTDPDTAQKIAEIHLILTKLPEKPLQLDPKPNMSKLRRRTSVAFWNRKVRRLSGPANGDAATQ
jgi:hypothetical protein